MIKAWVKDFTADLNQPAFKALVAGVLSIVTGLFYWIFCMAAGREIQEASWGLWLAFIAGLWGITYFDYRSKRETTLDRAQREVVRQEAAAQNPQEREPPPPGEKGG